MWCTGSVRMDLLNLPLSNAATPPSHKTVQEWGRAWKGFRTVQCQTLKLGTGLTLMLFSNGWYWMFKLVSAVDGIVSGAILGW